MNYFKTYGVLVVTDDKHLADLAKQGIARIMTDGDPTTVTHKDGCYTVYADCPSLELANRIAGEGCHHRLNWRVISRLHYPAVKGDKLD